MRTHPCSQLVRSTYGVVGEVADRRDRKRVYGMLTGHLWELMIVLVIALVVFGPKRLPEIGSSVGKGIREFRNATAGIGATEAESVEKLAE